MGVKNLPTFNTSQFSYYANTRMFVTEISDLNIGHNLNRLMSQAYDDAADTGFDMVSDRTGRVARFYFESEMFTDGELLGWRFICPENENPAGIELTCDVLND